jgi:hypothetical protein
VTGWHAGRSAMQVNGKFASWPGYESGLTFIARRFCMLWGGGS